MKLNRNFHPFLSLKMRRGVCASVIAGLLLNLPTIPLQASAGKSSSSFLKVDVGARAIAMAGTQYGAENDAFSPFYNPALFANAYQKEIGFMHNQYFEDIKQEVFTYVHPMRHYGNFAAGLNYFSYGSIDGYDSSGTPTGGKSASDMALNFSWSKLQNFTVRSWKLNNFSTGASLKILRRNLADETALGFALDAGISYPLHLKYLKGTRMGLAIQNLGPGISFNGESSPLPTTARLGFVHPFFGQALTTTADFLYANDEGLSPLLGIEYRLLKVVSLRAGYKGNKSIDKKLTYGIGFENPLFRVDYAFVTYQDLGATHRISLNYFFGRSLKRPKVEAFLQEKLQQAQTLYAQGALVDSYLIVIEIYRIAPWLTENNNLLSKIRQGFKELEESDYKEKLRLQIEAILTRGEKYYEQGNLLNARADFLAVQGIEPDNRVAEGYLKQIDAQFASFVDSFYRNGMVAFASENYEAAKDEFEKVLSINPDHADAKIQMERCIKILEQKEQEMAEAVKQDTLSKTVGEALKTYKEGKYEDSIRLFNAVLELNPSDEEAKRYIKQTHEMLFNQYVARGRERLDKNELESAIKNFRAALEHNPKATEIKSLATSTQRQWDIQKKALSQNLYRTGLEAFLSGDKNKAKEIWQKAVAMDPDNEEAKRGLGRIEATK